VRVADDPDDDASRLSCGHVDLRSQLDHLDVEGDEVVARVARADASLDPGLAGSGADAVRVDLEVVVSVRVRGPAERLLVEAREVGLGGRVDLEVDDGIAPMSTSLVPGRDDAR
jgi:hypothetical protein